MWGAEPFSLRNRRVEQPIKDVIYCGKGDSPPSLVPPTMSFPAKLASRRLYHPFPDPASKGPGLDMRRACFLIASASASATWLDFEVRFEVQVHF